MKLHFLRLRYLIYYISMLTECEIWCSSPLKSLEEYLQVYLMASAESNFLNFTKNHGNLLYGNNYHRKIKIHSPSNKGPFNSCTVDFPFFPAVRSGIKIQTRKS